MSPYILVLTHLAAAGFGAGLCYILINRYTKIVEVEGHPAIEIMPQEERVENNNGVRWPGLLLLILGVVAVVIGAQTYLGKKQEDRQERDDAKYATCIKNYAEEGLQAIVDTVNIRTTAGSKVEAAEIARDDAVDEVLRIVIRARETPPRATEEDFDRALLAAAEAKTELREERAAAAEVRSDNEYDDAIPESECQR